jgi:hypothetical protein
MEERIVFSAGEWISVPIPIGCDPAWTSADSWVYAAAWASARRSGHTPAKASVLAEAIVYRRLYPGIQYEVAMEKDISCLFT